MAIRSSHPAFLLTLVFLLLPWTYPMYAQGLDLTYSLAPVGNGVRWDGQAGLSDAFFYGGEVGLGFGRVLEANALYLRGNDVETSFDDFSGEPTAVNRELRQLPPRGVSVDRYGGRVQLNLGQGYFRTFASLGTGVLQFEPVNLDPVASVYVSPGAGFVLSAGSRYSLSAEAELLTYRYHPASFLSQTDAQSVGQDLVDFDQRTVYNPSLRGALTVYLGSRYADLRQRVVNTRRGWAAAPDVTLEPFYGQVNFHDALPFKAEQPLTGFTLGTTLGPYVDLNGFYWRGTQDEDVLDTTFPNAFDDIQFYGGAFDLRLNTNYGRGFVPYLTLGGGYLDVLTNYVGRTAASAPDDRFFALGGGGLEVPLASALRLNAGVRALLASDQDLSTLQESSQIYASPLYRVGLRFRLGERRPPTNLADVVARERQAGRLRSVLDSLNRAAARREALAELEDELSEEALAQLSARELQRLVELRMQEQAVLRAAQPADSLVSNISNRSVTIPVPERGEIYLRFGATDAEDTEAQTYGLPASTALTEGGGLSADEIRQIVRETLSEQLQQLDEGDLEAQRLADRMDRLEDRIEQRIDSEIRQLRLELLRRREGVTVVRREDGETIIRVEEEPTFPYAVWGRELNSALSYTGFRVGEGPEQLLFGVRGDYRSSEGGWFRFMPEAALGFGGGTSINVAGNVVFPVATAYTFPYQPYTGLGIGLFSESGFSGLELGWNLLLGAEYPSRFGVVFGEFSTLNLFDFNRLLVGYRFEF